MTVNVDPSVSLFISNLRNSEPDKKEGIINHEIKKLNLKTKSCSSNPKIDAWKRLYLVVNDVKIDSSFFIVACSSKELFVKRIGYQGLAVMDCSKELILMTETIKKDLVDDLFINEALIFLSNIIDKNMALNILSKNIEIPSYSSNLYNKSLVAKSKYSNELVFKLSDNFESRLFIKLQILLDLKRFDQILPSDYSKMLEFLKKESCSFTKIKILQVFNLAINAKKYNPTEAFLEILKQILEDLSKKNSKQIDLGFSLEAVKLLIATNNNCEKTEEFIFKLISSENVNFRYIGFKLILKHKIISEIAMNQIVEIGIQERICFETLMSLINDSNYKIIYNRISEFSYEKLNSRLEIEEYESAIEKIVIKTCEYGNNDFIKVALCEYPKIYLYIKKKIKMSKETAKEILDNVLHQTDPKYFILIYSLYKELDFDKVVEIGMSHLRILLASGTEYDWFVLNFLNEFLCNNGDANKNREMMLNILTVSYRSFSDKKIEMLIACILRFNIILEEKLIYLKDASFISYTIKNNELTITYPSFVRNLKVNAEETNKQQEINSGIRKVFLLDKRQNYLVGWVYQNNEYKKIIRNS